ncbi:MAG: NAD-dependent malic enzyme [SAR324 cluster bacterium]|jgi:malate dehydrogenase (oxaloacetate-decarboxylating)|nr:NAD-dependent malic enzyme [SAR324 cluster bacterium]MCH2265847.1 NAD-dependent malic enzyme [SAR324 cluster bacterium]
MTVSQPAINASNSIIVRLKIDNEIGMLASVTQTISELHGIVGAIDLVKPEAGVLVRDISIFIRDQEHSEEIVSAIKNLQGVEFINFLDRTFLAHLGGKISIRNRIPVKTRDDLSMAYTPGVARVCMDIFKDPEDAYKLTIKGNTIAVVTDGTAVLGLGDIGPKAAMPVMEGKAMLFKEFADIDAWPICLDTKDTEEIIRTVKAIAPGFGGINLEDISAPRCFEIERRLREELDIPVFHDDQHGTAVVSTAALINALKFVNKKVEDIKVVVSGAGAAGTACSKMILQLGVKNLIGCDSKGAIHAKRSDLNPSKQWFVENTNPNNESGKLKDVIAGADVFLGVSAPNVINGDDVKRMAKDPIVFAMSNPDPEISPDEARPLVAVMATGRSDYPNQINNVLCFPGIFRGALDCLASTINEEMKLATAHAIAGTVKESHLCADYIIPSVFDSSVAPKIAKAVQEAAIKTGVARRIKS